MKKSKIEDLKVRTNPSVGIGGLPSVQNTQNVLNQIQSAPFKSDDSTT